MLDLAGRNADLALRYNPQSATALLSRAMVSLYSGQTATALEYFGKSLQEDPGNPETLLYKAQAYRDMGQYGQAESVYAQITRDRPNYWRAWHELGWVLSKEAKYDKAAAAFDNAAAVAPNAALPLASMGMRYLEAGYPDKAEAAFRQSVERGPTDEAYSLLRDVQFLRHEYQQALESYKHAAQLHPVYDQTWRNIGDCYAILGQPDMAQKSYAHAAELLSELVATNSRNGASWATLAFYEAKTGNSSEAESDIAKPRARGAHDVGSNFMIVQALAVLGKKEEALQLLLKCVDQGLTPVNVDLALDLSEIRKDPRYLSRIARQSSGNAHES